MASVAAGNPRAAGFLVAAGAASVALGSGIGIVGPGSALPFAVGAAVVIATVVLFAVAGPRAVASLAIVAAAATLGMNDVRITSFMSVADAFLLAAAAALFIDPRTWRRVDFGPVQLQIGGFALIILGGLLGSFYAQNALASVAVLLKLVVASALLLFLVLVWSPSVRAISIVAVVWVGSACASSAVAILADRGLDGRDPGLTTHPNHLALVCVLAIGPALVLTGATTGFHRAAGLCACVLITTAVVISGSRAGMLGYCVALAMTFALSGRLAFVRGLFGTRAIVAGFICAGGIGFALTLARVITLPFGNALDRVLGRGVDVAASDAARRAVVDESLATAYAHPIAGNGFEGALAAHNIYLQIWAAAGLVGVTGFLMIVWATLAPMRQGRMRRLRATHSTAGGLSIGLTAGFAGFLAAGLFSNALWDRYIWLAPALVPLLVHRARHGDAGADHNVVTGAVVPMPPAATSTRGRGIAFGGG